MRGQVIGSGHHEESGDRVRSCGGQVIMRGQVMWGSGHHEESGDRVRSCGVRSS